MQCRGVCCQSCNTVTQDGASLTPSRLLLPVETKEVQHFPLFSISPPGLYLISLSAGSISLFIEWLQWVYFVKLIVFHELACYEKKMLLCLNGHLR